MATSSTGQKNVDKFGKLMVMNLLAHKYMDYVRHKLFFLHYITVVHCEIKGNLKTVADIGCGKGKVIKDLLGFDGKLNTAYLVGLDIYRPYLVESKIFYHNVVLCDARYLPLRSSSIDLVLATELIEHLDKADGLKLLTNLDKIAKKRIIITAPVGLNPKHHLENGNIWQAHRSVWYPAELQRLGYKVRGLNGLRTFYRERAEFRTKARPLSYMFCVLSLLTQFAVYRLSCAAYQMLGAKVKA